jgi:hypothetical protein
MAANGSPAAERPATVFQLHRLNLLECLRRVAPGEGDTLTFAEADALLEETARRGLWTPRRALKEETARQS